MAAPEWTKKRGIAASEKPAELQGDDTGRGERVTEGLCAQVRLSRAILGGVALDSILSEIARAARRHATAEFVAIGISGGSPSLLEAWDGPREWRMRLTQEPLLTAWRRALDQGQDTELEVADAALPPSGISAENIGRVIAHPIETQHRTRGVLMAAVRSPKDCNDDKLILELYALLAASALDREDTSAIRAECLESLRTGREAEMRLKAEINGLMDSIDAGVLLLDATGNIRMISNRLTHILGLDGHSLFELRTIEALIENVSGRLGNPAEASTRWREHSRSENEASWDEFELVRPARKVIERFAKHLFDTDGVRLGTLQVYHDISKQRVVQAKLLQTEKMAALGQLVSGIAHELNNPLTSMQGYAQLLLTRQSATERETDARRIFQEAARAGKIVKNLLLFSRETRSERRAVDLNEIIERTFALRAYELKTENIAADMDLHKNLPKTLADAAQLQQVVLNFLINAEHAIQQGREHGARCGHIHIRTRGTSGDRIEMEISDDGVGIPAEVVSRIFDPFFTTKPAGVGTGLGPSIVYGIVQDYGGNVRVESETGHGARFTVELPALASTAGDFMEDVPSDESGPEPIATASVPAQTRTRSERILVVEDEPTVAQLIADVESEEGYRVDMLLDSRETMQRIQEIHYDLIICDLKMPHLDGPGLYRALIRAGSYLQHRLLFVTGDIMSPRTLEFLRASGSTYLAKPFLVEELKESVRLALSSAPVGGLDSVEAERSRILARGK